MLIHDGNWQEFINPIVNGERKSTGLKPRNYSTHPVGCMAFAEPVPADSLIPESEWPQKLAEQQASKAGLLDLRSAKYELLKSLDQNGYGLCWAFSTTKAVMYVRAIMNEPDVRLSAWWVAGRVKGWADEGGWGAESLAEIVKAGVPPMDVCPSYSSRYDTQAALDAASANKVTEWWDGSDNRDLARRQMVSTLLTGLPCVVDLGWMGHSMCAVAVTNLNPLRVVFDNSWGENAGDRGLYTAEGSRAIPDGLVIPRVALPSPT